jgi:hypothetical protein
MSQIGARSAYLALRDFDPANVSCEVMNDKTQNEHNASAFGCIATKLPSIGAPLSLMAEP